MSAKLTIGGNGLESLLFLLLFERLIGGSVQMLANLLELSDQRLDGGAQRSFAVLNDTAMEWKL